MRILFSPVGGSDPIKRMLDGPMLHCCRVYKPDIVCLYFTQSMLEYENRDQRYTWALEKLGEKLNHKFEIIKIEREDLVDVHKFYIFYNDFGKIFEEIEEKYPDAEFYVNTSSGTPAMNPKNVLKHFKFQAVKQVLCTTEIRTKHMIKKNNGNVIWTMAILSETAHY